MFRDSAMAESQQYFLKVHDENNILLNNVIMIIGL